MAFEAFDIGTGQDRARVRGAHDVSHTFLGSEATRAFPWLILLIENVCLETETSAFLFSFIR